MQFVSGETVGIDLGTTFSVIARLDAMGTPRTLPNRRGEPTTASVVLFKGPGEAIVGPTAEDRAGIPADNVVTAVKRHVGDPSYRFEFAGRRLTAEFISAMILRKLKQDAERHIGPIGNAVITVPYYFNDASRRATQRAGQITGLNVIDIINEPTAATLGHAWQRGELGRLDLPEDERTVLVFDLGGGTFDVTLVRYTPRRFRVLATDGDVLLGGLDWTQRMAEYCCDRFCEWFAADPREDPQSFSEVLRACEAAKRALSRRPRAIVSIHHDGRNVDVEFTDELLQQLTADLLQRTLDTTERVLETADVRPAEVHEILLVGGSTRMPMVRRKLQELCGRPPATTLDPDQAVAHGAAVHAAILEARTQGTESRMGQAVLRRLRSVHVTDVNAHALGVLVTDPQDLRRKFNHIMIPANTPLPVSVRQRFVTTVPNQRRIDVHVLEGEARDPGACHHVTGFRIAGLPPGLPIGAPVEVEYRYDENGRIDVRARELTSGRGASVAVIRGATADADVEEAFRRLAAEYTIE
ncbi:MAG: Hsp70 family protein [Planctomycetota bacterium]|nr:MAG: Hsp70 family protein [Planctomycetota bacterium]